MVRPIMRDPLFLAQKSEPATEAIEYFGVRGLFMVWDVYYKKINDWEVSIAVNKILTLQRWGGFSG